MKKLLITLIIASVVVILGVGGYYLRSSQESAPAPVKKTDALPATQTPATQNASTQNQPVGAIGGSKLNLVSQNLALDYFVDKGSNVFILQPDSQVMRASAGKTELLSATSITGITSASFSFDGKKILVSASDSLLGNRAHIFDVEKKTWSLFPGAVSRLAWSPNSHQLAYTSTNGGVTAVYTVDTDNSRAKQVEVIKIHTEDAIIDWPYSPTIFLSEAPNSGWASSLWSLNISQKTLSPLILDRPGLETTWSSSSPAVGIVFSSDSAKGQGGRLQLVDQAGKQLQVFDFLTFPSKCAFYNKLVPQAQTSTSSSTISTSSSKTAVPAPKTVISAPKTALMMVCAIPRDKNALDNNALPDAYLKKALFTSDDFFEINVSTGEFKSVFADDTKNLDADGVKIFNQSVFFINRYDKKVYSIALPK